MLADHAHPGGRETAVDVTEQTIQVLGGNGCTRDPVERWHLDAGICTIFEGSSETRLIVRRAVSGHQLA